MRRMALRTRLTIIHTGLFLLASLVVVSLIYLQNRQSILSLREEVTPRLGIDTSVAPRTYPEQPWGDVLTGLLFQSLFTFLALGAIAGLLGWWLSGRVLRRVHTMTSQAQRISTANLHERIALAGPHDELKELADTFNGLLTRLDDAFQVQGRFIANASHELRTPLAVTRTVIQVGLSSPSPDRVERAKAELLRSNDRSIALINGLLQLARGEQELQHPSPVRLDTVVQRTLDESPPSPSITISVDLSPCTVLGDDLLLSQLFRNLLDNALRHNLPSSGNVSIQVTPHGRLVVSNTGPPIPASNVSLLFEPFHRGPTRTDGAGLGLSIVRAITLAHRGHITASPRPSGGLTITIDFPPLPSDK